ncbi:MAG: hypothetical protein LBU88_08000 [Treponema sp.]|jgi:hypothetical protein|nr:hypothetical protein [Treponema sp.]
MKIKTLSVKTLLIIFSLFCFVHILPANDSPRPIQRFSWAGDNNALRYEVIIENEASRTVFKEFTSEPFIEASLPPGNYRIQVIPHDFRNMPAGDTGWIAFNVPARQASEHTASEEPGTKVSDSGQSDQTTKPEETRTPDPDTRDYKPLPFNYYFSAAYMPFIPVYNGEGDIFGSKPSLAGAVFRFAMISNKDLLIVNPGFDLAISWFNVGDDNSITITLNLLAQKYHISDKTAITFRLGAGFIFLPESYATVSEAQRFHVNMGLSFLWLASDLFFLEAGVDFTHYFTSYASGCFRPWIGAGIRF